MAAWRCLRRSGCGALEEGNAKLKGRLAYTMLDNAALTRRAAKPTIFSKKMVTSPAMREAVAHLQASVGINERQTHRRAVDARPAPPVLALPNQR